MDSITDAVISFSEKHFGEFKVRNNQIIPRECPFCHGGEHGDWETFSIGEYNGCWSCKRGSCPGIDGKREGTFYELRNYFGETGDFGYVATINHKASKQKSYVRPDPKILRPLTEDIITYFTRRRISEQTLEDWNISADKDGNIVFPFYEDGILTYVKYRAPKKMEERMREYKEKLEKATPEEAKMIKKPAKEWMMSNTKPILFGMDKASFNKPLVICEGQIDALSLYEAGVTNVVSVPAGVDNMDWIELCWNWLEKFNRIILFGDSDEPGRRMINELNVRLNEARCMLPPEYPECVYNGQDLGRACKDANDILCCYGPEVLKKLVDSAEPSPIKGLINVGSIIYTDPTTIPRIMSRIPKLDKMLGGFKEGGVYVLSGKRGEGKSTFSGPVVLNAIEQGYVACVYSGELSKEQFLDWTILQATESKYISYKFDERSEKNICVPSPEIRERVQNWIDGKLWLYDNEEVDISSETEHILKIFETCARRYGAKMFVVDNLMSALLSPDEENKAQARFTAQLKAFAKKFRAVVMLIAHPRKEKAGTTLNNDSISGSSAITNLADGVIYVEKPNLRITKNRDFGETGWIQCCYDPVNRHIYEAGHTDHSTYPWDHTGISIPEAQAVKLKEFAIRTGNNDEGVQPF